MTAACPAATTGERGPGLGARVREALGSRAGGRLSCWQGRMAGGGLQACGQRQGGWVLAVARATALETPPAIGLGTDLSSPTTATLALGTTTTRGRAKASNTGCVPNACTASQLGCAHCACPPACLTKTRCLAVQQRAIIGMRIPRQCTDAAQHWLPPSRLPPAAALCHPGLVRSGSVVLPTPCSFGRCPPHPCRPPLNVPGALPAAAA